MKSIQGFFSHSLIFGPIYTPLPPKMAILERVKNFVKNLDTLDRF